jgi:hypothetical protein
MSGHAILPGLIASSSGMVVVLANVRGEKGRRALLFLFALLTIGAGIAVPHLVSAFASAAWIGWLFAGVGALLLYAAGPAWRDLKAVNADEAGMILKPATNRPLRHFGETP